MTGLIDIPRKSLTYTGLLLLLMGCGEHAPLGWSRYVGVRLDANRLTVWRERPPESDVDWQQ